LSGWSDSCIHGRIGDTGSRRSSGADQAIRRVRFLMPSGEIQADFARRVTGGPSGKTDYVVVGDNAGASKLDKIKSLSIKTLNEDQFLDLIASREGAEPDEKQLKAMAKEEKKIQDAAKEMEKKEKDDEKLRKRKEAALGNTGMAAK